MSNSPSLRLDEGSGEAPAKDHDSLTHHPIEVDTRATMVRSLKLSMLFLAAGLALSAGVAHGMGNTRLAGLQVGLMRHGLYEGPADGIEGPATRHAVFVLQKRTGLPANGAPGRRVRAALGRWARWELGDRMLQFGAFGWDVAELQFELAWHGFPSGVFDGVIGSHVHRALVRYQTWASLDPDGIAGPRTLASLRSTSVPRCPLRLAWPLRAPVSSLFGPRGFGFHSGVDLAAPSGTPTAAAARGRVVWAAPAAGGWGNLVIVEHRRGVQTMYAHLSRIDVFPGQRVAAEERIGLVGATGDASGPHLHFEVRVRGAAVDPLRALG
jgi:Peptidase family M23/Putative peptidoglycan binding domain